MFILYDFNINGRINVTSCEMHLRGIHDMHYSVIGIVEYAEVCITVNVIKAA